MFERNIGIRLTLLPAFAEATKLIISDISSINEGLKSISDLGKSINIDGLTTLNTELVNLVEKTNLAKQAIESLNGVKLTNNLVSSLNTGIINVGVSAKTVKEDIKQVGNQTEQTSNIIQTQLINAGKSITMLEMPIEKVNKKLSKTAIQAAETASIIQIQAEKEALAFLNVSRSIVYTQDELKKLADFKVADPTHSMIIGMKNVQEEIARTERALERLNEIGRPRSSLMGSQLQEGQLVLGSGRPRGQIALGPGKPDLPTIDNEIISSRRHSSQSSEVLAWNDILKEARLTEQKYGTKPIKLGANIEDQPFKTMSKAGNLQQFALGPGLSSTDLNIYKLKQIEDEKNFSQLLKRQQKDANDLVSRQQNEQERIIQVQQKEEKRLIKEQQQFAVQVESQYQELNQQNQKGITKRFNAENQLFIAEQGLPYGKKPIKVEQFSAEEKTLQWQQQQQDKLNSEQQRIINEQAKQKEKLLNLQDKEQQKIIKEQQRLAGIQQKQINKFTQLGYPSAPIPGQLALGSGLSRMELNVYAQQQKNQRIKDIEALEQLTLKENQTAEELEKTRLASAKRILAKDRLLDASQGLSYGTKPIKMGGMIDQGFNAPQGVTQTLGEKTQTLGEKTQNIGKGVMRHGDIMQSAGWAAAMNAIMISSVATPIIKQLVELQDLYGVAAEALNTAGVTPKNQQNMMQAAEIASTKYGGSLRENVSGMYTFASSIPAVSRVDMNDPKQAALLKAAYEKITEGVIVGGRSTHPISQEHGVLDIISAVTNLGMPASNAKELSESIIKTTDMFVQYKNSTSTDFDLLGTTLRNVGAVAKGMGIPAEDLMALVGVLAQGKYRGSIAGTSLKRLFSNEVMEPKQARSMMKLVKSFGGDISAFDEHGKPQSMMKVLGNIAKFEDEHHLPAKQRAQLESSISGRYAWPQVSEMIALTRAFGGEEGLKKYKAQQMAAATAGTGATDAALEARNPHGTNISMETKKIDNSALIEMHNTFKLIEPDIINILHGVQSLINAWHGLSDPVKKNILDWTAILTIGSGVIGVLGILIGNYTKLAGVMLFAGGNALKLGEHLLGQSLIFPQMTNGIEKLGQATIGIIPRAFGAASAAVMGFQVAIGPIGWAIEAVIAVGALFALAWSKDWGGIREKVAGFPEFLGGVVGNISVQFGKIGESFNIVTGKLGQAVQDTVHNIRIWFSDIPKNWHEIGELIGKTTQDFVDHVRIYFEDIPKNWKRIGEVIGQTTQNFIDNIRVFFSDIPKSFSEAASNLNLIWSNTWNTLTSNTLKFLDNINNSIKNFKFNPIQIKIDLGIGSIFGGERKKTGSQQTGEFLNQFGKGYNDSLVRAHGGNTEPGVADVAPISLLQPGTQSSGSNLDFLTKPAKVIKPSVKGPIGPTLVAAQQIINQNDQVHDAVNNFVQANSTPAITGGTGGGYTSTPSPVVSKPTPVAASAKPAVNPNASDQEVADAIAALFDPQKKGKTKKSISDGFMVLKNESIAQVEDTANKITHALEKAGAVLHKKWIDILDPKTFKVTRVFGDVAAYEQALGNKTKTKDNSVQIAHDYLMKIKREVEHNVPVDTEKVLANIAILYAHALSEHSKNTILQMGDTLAHAFHIAGDKIAKEFDKTKKSVLEHIDTTSRAGNKFDLIQQQMGEKVPQLGENATTKDLKKVISAETSERNALASALLNEQEDAKGLAVKYAELTVEINKFNGSSAYEKTLRDEKKKELSEVSEQYSAVTNRIIQQRSVVDDLTLSIEKQNAQIKNAKDTWNGLINTVQQKSITSLVDQNFKDIANHVQNYFQLQNSPGGPAGNSSARQQANTYANTMMQNLFQGLFGESSNNILEKIKEKANKKTGQPATTVYEQKQDKANDLLTKINKNTEYLNPAKSAGKNASSNPTPVTVYDASGSTDVGQSLLDTQNSILNNTASATYTGGKATSNKAGDQPDQKTSLQKIQDLAGEASQAFSLFNGLRAGGIGGALQAGSAANSLASSLNMTPVGQAIVTGVMAIMGAIGIGPHETAAQQPDINDPMYRQLLPNWAGTQQTLNGQVIQPNQQYSSYAGAQNQAQQMYAFVSNPSSQLGMNPDQQKSIQQMAALAVNKSGVNMGAAGLAIKSEHQGELTLASGQEIKVTDFENLLTTNQGMLTQFQNNALQAQQNADRLASSFTSFVLNGPAGFTMPDFVGGSPSSISRSGVNRMPSPFTGSVNNGTNDIRKTESVPQNITVHILQGANIQGATTEQIQEAIHAELPSITAAMNGSNYQSQRLSGNYVSSNW